eukprot:g5922.t1
MEAGERNLSAIYLHEKPDLHTIRSMFSQLFEAVDYLHSKNIMHGDLKLLNVVRFASDNRLRIIDFDAAASIPGDDDPAEGVNEFAGAKFSSGALPPEMLYRLKDKAELEKFEAYFAEDKDQKDAMELWSKIEPKKGRKLYKFGMVVKTFSLLTPINNAAAAVNDEVGDDDEEESKRPPESEAADPRRPSLLRSLQLNCKVDPDTGEATNGLGVTLPYTIEEASKAIDVWALGTMLFLFLTEENLVPVNRNDDITKTADMVSIADWDENAREQRLGIIKDPMARDLLAKLLSPSKEDRETLNLLSLKETHPFFNPELDDATIAEIKKNQEAMKKKLDEANRRLVAIDRRTIAIQDFARESRRQLMLSVLNLQSVVVSVSENECPTAFVIIPSKAVRDSLLALRKEADSESKAGAAMTLNVEKAKSVFERMSGVMTTLTTAISQRDGVKGLIESAIDSALGATENEFEMHLLCERCYEPQPGDDAGDCPWPIKITEPKELMPKVLPMARGCLKAARLANGTMKLGRLLGLPLPTIPEDWLLTTENAIGNVEDKARGSLEDYECVKTVFEGEADEEEQRKQEMPQVGHCLRAFKTFLKEHDKDDHWCKLNRVVLPGADKTCWVCDACVKALKSGGGSSDEGPKKATPPSVVHVAADEELQKKLAASEEAKLELESKLKDAEAALAQAEEAARSAEPSRRRSLEVARLKRQVTELQSKALGAVNGASVGFMNLSIGHNSIGFYQASKLAIIPAVVTLQALVVPGGTWPRPPVLAVLAAMLVGVGLVTVSDVSCNRLGSAYAAVAVLGTAVSQTSIKLTMDDWGVSQAVFTKYQFVVAVPCMAVLVAIFEGPGGLVAARDLVVAAVAEGDTGGGGGGGGGGRDAGDGS